MDEFYRNLFKNEKFCDRQKVRRQNRRKQEKDFMKIWEDEKQVYIRASMERNTPEQNVKLKERLEQID